MARHYIVIITAVLFLVSCAQIGTISGGEKDVFAPVVIHDRTNPPNESTNFKGAQVELTFNEYFKLVSPAQNIMIIPPHASIMTSVRKKTVTLSWEDTLQENTTYSIYLNGAIADITESNDSIYQYVFSTGPVVDSITYTTFIVDAKSGEPLNNISLICYDQSDQLVSLANSNEYGEVTLRFLKPGSYKLLAINDQNKNMNADEGEALGFREASLLELQTSKIDSVPIRLFLPEKKPKIRTVKFRDPASILIGATAELDSFNIYIDGTMQSASKIKPLSRDSVQLFFGDLSSGLHELVLKSSLIHDTVTFRVPKNIDSNIVFTSSNDPSGIKPSDTLRYVLNDLITSVNSDSIQVFNSGDSTYIKEFNVKHKFNELYILFDKKGIRDAEVSFGQGAVICFNRGLSKAFEQKVVFNESRSYGTLLVDLSAYSEQVILELIQSGKAIRNLKVENPSETIIIPELLPGNYTFNVIIDSNNNGIWDTGDLDERRQPEEIDHYSKSVSVRANWELEVPLVPNAE